MLKLSRIQCKFPLKIELDAIAQLDRFEEHNKELSLKEKIEEPLKLGKSLNEKIEERNEELLKLRKKTTTTVQILTHVREKLQARGSRFLAMLSLRSLCSQKRVQQQVRWALAVCGCVEKENNGLREELEGLEASLSSKRDMLGKAKVGARQS
eukprot:711001-Pelagomonas_calceolata.AAC.3